MRQFGIQYRVAAPQDARWSRVKILCKHHPDQMIAQWSTFDGKRALVGLGDAAREEYVGHWTPDNVPGGPQGSLAKVLTPAVAAPNPGDVPHARISLRCERPSCTYQPQIRDDHVQPLNDFVLALRGNGRAEHVISDLDVELRPRKR